MDLTLLTWFLEVFFVTVLSSQADGGAPQMFRRLHKTGFHRELYTSVKWTVKPHHRSDVQNCGMMLVETLPSGVYVDPFQLENSLQFGGPKVLVDGPVDIEKPEHISPEHVIQVYTDLRVARYDNQGCTLSGSVTVPIHLRYHQPASDLDTQYIDIVIHNPRFYINCTLKDSESLLQAACDHTNSSQCLWHEFLYQADKDGLVCSVPVGNLSHFPYVVSVTLLVTCGGCLLIMLVVVRKPGEKLKVS